MKIGFKFLFYFPSFWQCWGPGESWSGSMVFRTKNWMEKSAEIFWSENAIYLSQGFHKKRQSSGEAFSPQKRSSSTGILFSIFVDHFCPPGFGSGSRDPIESGSNPDPQHCFLIILLILKWVISLTLTSWVQRAGRFRLHRPHQSGHLPHGAAHAQARKSLHF